MKRAGTRKKTDVLRKALFGVIAVSLVCSFVGCRETDSSGQSGSTQQTSASGQGSSGSETASTVSGELSEEDLQQTAEQPAVSVVVADQNGEQVGEQTLAASSGTQAAADSGASSGSSSGITAGHSAQVYRSGEIPETTYAAEGGFGELSEGVNFTGDKHLVICGDSRTVGLYCSQAYDENEFASHMFYNISSEYTGIANNMVFVAKGGEGYDFFAKLGLALAALYLDEDAVLVVWYGVNDLQKADQYVSYMNGAGLQFGVPVYYMTVGPADKDWAYDMPDILAMNQKLRDGLDPAIGIIDTFTFIQTGMDAGTCATLDGLHYTYETDRQIVDYMRQVISEDLGGIEL